MKKKSLIRFILVGVLIVGFSYLMINIFWQVKKQNQLKKNTEQLPIFSFQTLDNKPFTKAQLRKDSYTLFVYFNPDCHICHIEAEEFLKQIDKFKGISIYFITDVPLEQIEQFAKEKNLIDKVTFLYDENGEFYDLFQAKGVPFMVLYDKEGNKVNTYNGGINLDKILVDAKVN